MYVHMHTYGHSVLTHTMVVVKSYFQKWEIIVRSCTFTDTSTEH